MIKVYIMADSRFDASKLIAKNQLDPKTTLYLADLHDIIYMHESVLGLLNTDSKPALNDRKPVVWLAGSYLQNPLLPLVQAAIESLELEHVIK